MLALQYLIILLIYTDTHSSTLNFCSRFPTSKWYNVLLPVVPTGGWSFLPHRSTCTFENLLTLGKPTNGLSHALFSWFFLKPSSVS